MTNHSRLDEATGTTTVGHSWDGIEELNTPLPRWWLLTFYACIAFAIGYVILYPAIPMLHSATPGTTGWTSRGQLEQEMAAENARRAPMLRQLAATPLEQLPANKGLMQFAIAGGGAAFRANCIQCHGTGAAGSAGYPNLRDDDWLWGGDMASINFTITHGARNPDHDLTRVSMMPAFGRDGILDGRSVADVVSFVRANAQMEPQSASSARGAALFAANCVVCHGANGAGNRALGAPRLNDRIWLYGGSREVLTTTVTNARAGVMPRWGGRLDALTIKMLTAFVYSLGGGEASAPTVPTAPTAASATPVAATPAAE